MGFYVINFVLVKIKADDPKDPTGPMSCVFFNNSQVSYS